MSELLNTQIQFKFNIFNQVNANLDPKIYDYPVYDKKYNIANSAIYKLIGEIHSPPLNELNRNMRDFLSAEISYRKWKKN